ncbi:MAG: hypothetical protein AAGC74_12460 [Verrucomicrobiota bacterium]
MTILRGLIWIAFLVLAFLTFSQPQTAPSAPAWRPSLPDLTNQEQKPNKSKEPTQPTTSPNFASWPLQPRYQIPEPRILLVEENPDTQTWLYRSPHFDFLSNAPLRPHVVREFASLFELTHHYCRQLPFQLPRLQQQQTQPMLIQLLEHERDYVALGGLPGSGGAYLHDRDLIIVPFAGLGLKKSHRQYALDPHRTNQTLTHETTHMLMRGPLLQDGWFVEGSAEYVATIPAKNDRLLVSEHLASIKAYITSFGFGGKGGHNLGTNITLTPLKDFIEAPYDQFQQTPHAYPYSLLLFHFFAHQDEPGNAARLQLYAQSLLANSEKTTARKHLLAGRNYRTLEKLLTNSWHKHGINLSFSN